MHARKQIEDELVSRLTGLTASGSSLNFFRWPNAELGTGESPSVELEYQREDSQQRGTNVDREFAFDVVCRDNAAGTGTLGDRLNAMNLAVEKAIFPNGNGTLGGLVTSLQLQSNVWELDRSIDPAVGSSRMSFLVEYKTPADDPETIS